MGVAGGPCSVTTLAATETEAETVSPEGCLVRDNKFEATSCFWKSEVAPSKGESGAFSSEMSTILPVENRAALGPPFVNLSN